MGYGDYIRIDADYFRVLFPDYDGNNSSVFQKVCSWLVEQVFQYVIKKGYSFIFDATFAVPSAEKKVIKAIKNDYKIAIFYVYQKPDIAWRFTKDREVVEGKLVPKETFINAFLNARSNVEKVKLRHPEVLLHIIIKDYQNNISEAHFDTDNIKLVLPNEYSIENIEEFLNG